MAEDRKRLINLHTSTANNIPVGKLSLGEIAVEHSSVDGAKLYVETNVSSPTSATVATFITEKSIDTKINNAVEGFTDIVDDLLNVVITGASGDTIINVTVNNPDVSANTMTITHKTASTISNNFQKITTDGFGHVTGGTNVAIGDITGLTGWANAVKAAETKLSTGSTGSGNVVKGISVDDHTITTIKGSITSGDVTDFAEGVVTSETKLSTGSTGSGNAVTSISVNDHTITYDLGKTFSETDHKHVGSDITGGTVGISYLPTATTVDSSSDNTTIPTSKAVNDAINDAVTSTMKYKGATSTLPSTAKVGDTYIASDTISIPANKSAIGVAQTAETGDYIIARTSGSSATWDVIEKNLDGAVTSTGMTSNQIVVANGSNTIISKDATSILVGSASTATNLDSAPSLAVSNTNKITVTAGGKTSEEFTVPFANSATTSVSANTVPLSGVQDADDLKAIEALTGTTGVLTKTGNNSWQLENVITDYADYSGLSQTGNLIDAYTMKQIIDANELVTSRAFNNLNDRVVTLSSTTTNLDNRVTALENATVDLSSVASAITINGQTYTVSNGGVNIGNYLSGSTKYVSDISQTTTASAVTTTFTVKEGSTTSTFDVVEPIIIDCGTY